MKWSERVLWVVAILLMDIVIFFMPIMAVLTAYVLISRPPWFKNWVDRIYS